jgi:16S rRNA processing protein RimM
MSHSYNAPPEAPLLTIGYIAGVRGLKGQLKLKPENDPPDWLTHVTHIKLTTATQCQWLTITHAQWHAPFVWVMLDGITTPEQASVWKGATVEALERDLPQLEQDSFRTRDLLHQPVWFVTTGQQVGQVTGVLFNQDEPFLEITLTGHAKPCVVPFSRAFFTDDDTGNTLNQGLWVTLDLTSLVD